jgi:hypothetical protein
MGATTTAEPGWRRAIRFDSRIPFSGQIIAALLELFLRRALRKLKPRMEGQPG